MRTTIVVMIVRSRRVTSSALALVLQLELVLALVREAKGGWPRPAAVGDSEWYWGLFGIGEWDACGVEA
jgi:hypothetical protein